MESTVKLLVPVKVDGKEIKAITLRSPKVGDSVEVESKSRGKGEGYQSALMLSRLSGLGLSVIHELDEVDFVRADKKIAKMRKDLLERAKELDGEDEDAGNDEAS